MTDIKRYCDAIAAAFKPRRIILFGSHAYGQPNEDSDVDVLAVMPKSRRVRRDTAVKIRLKVRADFPRGCAGARRVRCGAAGSAEGHVHDAHHERGEGHV